MSNPLLDTPDLPAFDRIEPAHIEPAIDHILEENRQAIAERLEQGAPYSWDNFVAPMEALEDRLDRAWSPVSHLNAVVNTPELRKAYEACLPKLSDYATELGQNEALFAAYRAVSERDDFDTLSIEQRRVVENALRDFRLAGVDLPAAEKARYKTLKSELSQLTTRFANNLLDATNAWSLDIDDEDRLAGLPDSARAMFRAAAERDGQAGWRVTLEMPSFIAVMTHAEDRSLRETVYEAFVTRASDVGPHAGEWDNGPVMDRILAIRHELAQLLGFDNYAQRSLATKMATDPAEVLTFLQDLAEQAEPRARQELGELEAFARESGGPDSLQPWDVAFYAEKLREARFAISQEQLKPYFPADRVVDGLFAVVGRLFGIRVRERSDVTTWHDDVRFFEIEDRDGRPRGRFYLDLYARPHKRGGAWMAGAIQRRRLPDGQIQQPAAFLTCNFTPPVGGKPSLLTHDEVTTLFHEFGHGLHHLLTQVEAASVAGISGVAWDAVELPSQFLENWCWEREALDLFARHHETGAPLPQELFERLRASRQFQAGMQMVRQLEFSLFDLLLHQDYDPATGARIQETLDEVRRSVAVIQPPAYNRFQHGFAHIFAGGYAAGYYSYKWAEVLSADAWSRFEEDGVFNERTGADFLVHILERGGSEDPMALFKAFRGREPSIEPLLRQHGITESTGPRA
ncbi:MULTISPECIES: oligopeptidase A [unclassified Guyparkeria]|uniref:oligopeptidase A n=1 Tax=unclassified Guyparkeria TaxID=2626246 RepID=UPI0007337808|nr:MULTISPECIES: oligopeptidase A [unclassified Guyparkeria]KTG17821.1 oligopeptidase A [Guyparkeria sp. XI15]OAE89532.1 oligopeptidase A [Guyparkeria sp. WRN-7]